MQYVFWQNLDMGADNLDPSKLMGRPSKKISIIVILDFLIFRRRVSRENHRPEVHLVHIQTKKVQQLIFDVNHLHHDTVGV